MNATPTLYEWAGGEAAIRRLMDRFYDRVEEDELLASYFPGGGEGSGLLCAAPRNSAPTPSSSPESAAAGLADLVEMQVFRESRRGDSNP